MIKQTLAPKVYLLIKVVKAIVLLEYVGHTVDSDVHIS